LENGESEVLRWNAVGKLLATEVKKVTQVQLDGQGTLYELHPQSPGLEKVVARLPDGNVAWQATVSGLRYILGRPTGGVVAAYMSSASGLRWRRFAAAGAIEHDGPLLNPIAKTSKDDFPFFQVDTEGGLLGRGSGKGASEAAFRLGPDGTLRWMQAIREDVGLLAGDNEYGKKSMLIYADRVATPAPWHEGWVSSPTFFHTWDLENRPAAFLLEPGIEFYEWYGSAITIPDGGLLALSKQGVQRYDAEGSGLCDGCTLTAAGCDDADPCTADACNPAKAKCTHQPIASCTKSAGSCFKAEDCDDGDPCTGDTCDKKTGACSHTALTVCPSGNACLYGGGFCVAGQCVIPPQQNCPKSMPEFGAVQGWTLAADSQRPQVTEAAGGDLLIAGGWMASRVQQNGVVRWRRVLDGGVGGATRTPADGLLATILQPNATAKPGWTRLVRLSPSGKEDLDVTVVTGLDDWWLHESMAERRRWLLPRANGGYVLVGQTAWGKDTWHGRMVALSQDVTVTLAVDVTLTGLGGLTADDARRIDDVWPAPDGGVWLAWHRTQPGGARVFGVARLGPDGKVVWNTPLAAEVQSAAFDPWRPRGLAKTGDDKVLYAFTITLQGISALTESPLGPIDTKPKPPNVKEVKTALSFTALERFAEQPGVFAAADLGHGPVSKGWPFQGPTAWVFYGMAWSYQGVYDKLAELSGHTHETMWVTSSGRVLTLAYGIGSYPTLVMRGKYGEFKFCTHPTYVTFGQYNCTDGPCYCDCNKSTCP